MSLTSHEVPLVLDDDASKEATLSIRIVYTRLGLEIYADGYGTADMMPGHGPPVFLEYYEGRLRLIVYGDINSEEPTHVIDLEGARETNRKEDTP